MGVTLVLRESHVHGRTDLVGWSKKVSSHRDVCVQILFITTEVQQYFGVPLRQGLANDGLGDKYAWS